MIDEKRLGTREKDGRMVYPQLNVHGATYGLPATTVGVGGGWFVVVPAGKVPTELIEQIRADLAKKSASK